MGAITFDLSTLPAKTYGDAAFDISSYASASSGLPVSFSSATSSVCTVAGNMVTVLAAGTCTINADQAGTSDISPASQVQQSITVNKKTLTVVAGTPPSQPQGTASAPTVTCTAGFVGSDGFVTKPSGAVYARILLSDGSTMYRKITVSATTPAGNYLTRCAGGDPGSNYTIGGYKDGKFTIGPPLPPALTISANNKSYPYGATPPTLDVAYSSGNGSGLVGTLSCRAYAKSDTGYASPIALSGTTPVVAGGYAIHCTGLSSSSYTITWADGALTVNPAPVAVTASSPPTQTHGATFAPSITCSATGFVGADSFIANPTGAVYDSSGTDQVSIDSTADAGSYTTKCSDGDPGSNYTISGYTPGAFTVQDTTAPVVTVPASMTLEATGPLGATATFSATASDAVDGTVAVSCNPASGSTLALGATTVTCSATDEAGNSASDTFTITVRDTTKPVLSGLPSDIALEATGAVGAKSSWDAPTASDTVDGAITPTCSPVSGSTFGLGATTVTCRASDDADNTGSGSFTVTVQDTTKPDTSLTSTQPANPTKQTGASFTFSGTDIVGVASFECKLDAGAFAACTSPKSYSGLAEGSHTFQVRARDAAGNADEAPASYTWTIDTTPPVITVGNVTVNATSPAGATVPFTPTVTDANPASPVVTCTPASGSTFGIGTTMVNCSATDAAGNTGTASFTVTVKPASTQLTDLQAEVQSLPSDPTTRKNLLSILRNAQAAADKGDIPAACDKLTSFVSQVRALSGKKIATPAADDLLVDARRIMAVLGCS